MTILQNRQRRLGSRGAPSRKREPRVRERGVYYTPPDVARHMLRHSLGPWLREHGRRRAEQLRLIDPACGEGVFLIEAYRQLLAFYQRRRDPKAALPWAERSRILLQHIFGVDADKEAACATIARLCQEATCGTDSPADRQIQTLKAALGANIRWGDALLSTQYSVLSTQCAPGADWASWFPTVFARQQPGFDIVVGNPPYMGARRMAHLFDEEMRDYWAAHYCCARGVYDLYTLFIEKACQLLREGGWAAKIVPNKLASQNYARPCRQLLQGHQLMRVEDLGHLPVFPGASVYPCVVVWRHGSPEEDHTALLRRPACLKSLEGGKSWRVPQSGLSAVHGWPLQPELAIERRVATAPLDQRATLHSGVTGFSAQRVAEQLRERTGAVEGFDFVVSGNIDRYQVRRGNVRFMSRQWRDPILLASASMTDAKRRLYREEKIIIAGLTRRLEAAWDQGGLALGVGAYAAANLVDAPSYLLGLLNSKLLSYLYATRHGAKRLAGGYLAMNKTQLSRLPIRLIDDGRSGETVEAARLAELVQLRQRQSCDALLSPESRHPGLPLVGTGARQIEHVEAEIDACVYRLYQLEDEEIADVEAAFEWA